ncbi:hypothetical protein [uncultured Tateyamaria sp.]|uniref:hypothetical protein n=1 Tax=uncultured Tateyamaria sp. TaxID=455651 RepID=UPI0026124233|nr:hypothetical protein [uncultured Tateyamaria sp.]
MKKTTVTLAALAGLATPAVALDYVCQVRDTGNGFISPVLALQFEPGAATGAVYDVYIDVVHGAPIQAKIKDRGNGKYRFTYRVNNIPARPSPARIGYRVELDTKRNTVIVRGSMPGVTNSFNGKGTCQEGILP